MRSIQLAYNKMSSSTLPQVFKEIKKEYEKSPSTTASALISVILSTDIDSNALVTASFISIAHKLDNKITERVLESAKSTVLLCYLQAMGVVDDEYVRQAVRALIKKQDLINVLRMLQMCAAVIDKETAKELRNEINKLTGKNEIKKTEKTNEYLPSFLSWALDQLSKGKSPFREILKEEVSSMRSTIREIEEKEGLCIPSTLTIATDREEIVAAKYGMNTALKKRVFSILVTSSSHQEAITALYKEGLKVKQFEEVFLLLLFLCLKESIYNRYYSDVAGSLLKTASSSYKKSFTKYIYLAIERSITRLDTLKAKEIYNLAMYVSALYLSNSITLKHLERINFSFAKSRAFARVLFKSVLRAYRDKNPFRVQRMRESEEVSCFFRDGLIDCKVLGEEDREDLDRVYAAMYKCA